MFDQSYKLHYAGYKTLSKGGIDFKEHIFAFTCRHHHRYIINVEEYPNFVFVIKFHLKAHSGSENKYRHRTNLKDTPRILRTCIEAMMYIQEKNPFASFGFIGSNDIDESETNTARYHLYKRVIGTLMSPIRFQHLEYHKKSAYLLLNRDNTMANLKSEIETMFKILYPLTFP